MAWAPFLATLVISLATLLLSGFALWRQASNDWVRQLEKRIDECERDRAKLHEKVDELERREMSLMRQLLDRGVTPR